MHRNLTRKTFVVVLLTAAAAFGQYKAAPAGAPPSDVPPAFASLLEKTGTQITDSSGKAIAEIWLVSSIKKGAKSSEENVTLPNIPHGTLLGVLRAPGTYNDRRGQVIKPGVYTLRYSMFPINGDSAQVEANKTIQILAPGGDPEGWFEFVDKKAGAENETGVEKIWLIWSERDVAEMESIKYLANRIDMGLVSDPEQIRRMDSYLKALAQTAVEVEKDEKNRMTKFKGRGEVLAGVVKLEHR